MHTNLIHLAACYSYFNHITPTTTLLSPPRAMPSRAASFTLPYIHILRSISGHDTTLPCPSDLLLVACCLLLVAC